MRDGTGAEERTEDGDEATGASAAEEREGEHNRRRNGFRRTSKCSQTDEEEAEDCSEGDDEHDGNQLQEGEGSDGGCQAATEGQTEREEEHGMVDKTGELQAQTGNNSQNCSQRQPCL